MKLGLLFCVGAVVGGAYWLGAQRSQSRPAGSSLHAPAPSATGTGAAPSVPSIEAAFDRVHKNPRDPEAWTALGDAQSAQHELEAAEHAYRTAIRLGDKSGLAHARLGFLHYGRQEDAEALALLEIAQKKGAEAPMLDFTVRAAQASLQARTEGASDGPETPPPPSRGSNFDAGVAPEPVAERAPPPAPPEPPAPPTLAPVEPEPPLEPSPCEVPAIPLKGGRTFALELEFNDALARLIIDTGASITVLTQDFVDRANIRPHPHRRVRAITANGRVEFSTAVIEQVSVGDRAVESTWVAICPDCVEDVADGLLGLDLQAAFGIQLDPRSAVVRIADCESP